MKLRWYWYVLCAHCWSTRTWLARIWCWFFDHDTYRGSRYDREPDYCDRCFIEWPQDARTLPWYLGCAYRWVVEREWGWFDRLDEWLQSHDWTFRRLPSWWEY